MARSRYEFIKIEVRLLNDLRFINWDDFTQLTYIKLIALAKQTHNKVKKDWRGIQRYLRTERSPTDIKETVERIATDMGNIGQNRWEFWFKDWDERYEYRGVEEEKDKEEEKESSSSKKKKPTYNGQEMRKQGGKWWVIPKGGGKWLEFSLKEKDIVWV